MKNKFTILGCGSSLGSPWITNYWGNCNKNNKKNYRTRCCAHFQYKNISTLIDTSPDLKIQFRDNKIKDVDAVMYTHEHMDQTSGIFELRPFFWKNKKKIEVYGSKKTIMELKKKFDFCFVKKQGYAPILKDNIIKNNFIIKKGDNQVVNAGEAAHKQCMSEMGILFEQSKEFKIAFAREAMSGFEKFGKDALAAAEFMLVASHDGTKVAIHSVHDDLYCEKIIF